MHTAFWGISYPVVKVGVGYADPDSFHRYEFVAAAPAMALLVPGKTPPDHGG